MDGTGTASNTTISAGGTQFIAEQGAGTAVSTTIFSGGTQEVDLGGTVSATVIKSGGTGIVENGGTAFAAISKGGLEIANAGGSGSAAVSSGGILVLAGDDDSIIPLVNARILAWLAPNATLHVVRGGGHLFLLDEHPGVIEIIDEFLSRDDSSVMA